MISPELFICLHLAIIVAVLVGMAVAERLDRRSWTRWHRRVRARHLTTEEMLRRLRKAHRHRVPVEDLDSL